MYSTEDLEVEQYKQVLGAYKRLNSLISLEGANSREYMSKMTDDEFYQTHQTDNELLNCLDSIPQTETSIHKVCRSYLGEKSHKFDYNTNMEDRERALNVRERELNDREQKLLKRESGLKALETQLSVRESQIRELVGRLEKAKKKAQSQLSIEPYEPICYIPPVKREERVYTFDNDIDSFSRENIEEVLRRVAELEETNVMLNERNGFLEEEIIRNTSDVNEQKYFLVREKEKLVNKENSLKCREQTLLNREHRLIENAKYINSTVKSVNQYIKSNAERGQGKCEVVNQNECKENNIDHLTFRGFLQSLDEIKDFSNLPEGENRIRR